MDILGIGYLGFESTSPGAWKDYGTDVLGFEMAASPADDPHSIYLRLDDRRHRIAIHPGEVDGLAYIGWEAKHRPAYEEVLESLRRHGVALTEGDAALCARRGVHEVAQFSDPVGYRHELFYGQKMTPGSFRPGRAHGGFAADDQGIGHVVLITPTYPAELDDFFLKVLGFEWFGYGTGSAKTFDQASGGGRAGLFRAKLNRRSHTIAYGHMPHRMGIQHLGIAVKELDDVGVAQEIVEQRQLQMVLTMGRHTNDPVVSFYHETPSGFAIELLWEERPWQGPYEANPERVSKWGHKLVGPMIGSAIRAV